LFQAIEITLRERLTIRSTSIVNVEAPAIPHAGASLLGPSPTAKIIRQLLILQVTHRAS